MRSLSVKWLSALLIACLLTTGAGRMEDLPELEAADEAILAEPVEAIVEASEIALDDSGALPGEASEEAFEPMDESGNAPLPLAAASGEVAVDADHFPDEGFRAYVLNAFDTDNSLSLSAEEIRNARAVELYYFDGEGNVRSYNPSTLKGIELFSHLETLCLRDETIDLTSLDLSRNAGLKEVRLDFTWNLISLTLGSLRNLEVLSVSGNQLTALDVSGCASLRVLACDYNQLASLKLGSLPGLETLICYGNVLSTLDISGCPAVQANMKQYPAEESDGVIHHNRYDEDGVGTGVVGYDKSTRLVTVAAIPASTPTPAPRTVTPTDAPSATPTATPVPGEVTPTDAPTVNPTETIAPTPTPTPVITVAKKSAKATVLVGTQYRIDLNGATARSFKSSRKKVATVDRNGVVTPRAKGKARITIKIGKKKRVLTLTVKDPTIPTKVTLNLSGTVAAKKGTTVNLVATLPAGTSSGIKWTSSNKKIATVKNGVVTFKKAGKVTITATATRGKKKARVKFKVTK